MELTDAEGETLVQLARNAVKTYLGSGRVPLAPERLTEALAEKRGVFVTILSVSTKTRNALTELRGCIGYLEARLRLAEATIRAAISAATGDPRFPPLMAEEFGGVIFEINALTKFQRIKAVRTSEYSELIEVGVDGLMLARGLNRGLLLPGVPVEWGWSQDEFLTECCLKAGLPPDAWLDKETKVYKFQSEIFRELEPGGRVMKVDLRSQVSNRG